MDVLRKLPPVKGKGKKRKEIINLIVIRVSKSGLLKNSAPCFMCVKHMDWVNRNTSYKIKNIYYSNECGNMIMMKVDDLINSEEKYVSMRFRIKKLVE